MPHWHIIPGIFRDQPKEYLFIQNVFNIFFFSVQKHLLLLDILAMILT